MITGKKNLYPYRGTSIRFILNRLQEIMANNSNTDQIIRIQNFLNFWNGTGTFNLCVSTRIFLTYVQYGTGNLKLIFGNLILIHVCIGLQLDPDPRGKKAP